MPGPSLLKRDWETDHVYLVQFPRAGCIPTPSPFALKLETWLRVADIPYSNVSNNFNKLSAKGQIPFIEVNGRQMADSNMIIEHLKKEFHKEAMDERSVVDAASARAFHALIEDSLRWALFYQRSRDNKWMTTEQGFIGHLSGLKKFAFVHFLQESFRKKLMDVCHKHGIGRHSKEEVAALAKADLDAISVYLGEKQYFGGDHPSTLDCTAFGHLTQFLYVPLYSPDIKQHMVEKTPNLVALMERIKTKWWPDWDEACSKLSLETQWKNRESAPAS